MKSFEQFRQEQLAEQEQLDEIQVPDWLNPIKWVQGAGNFVKDKVGKPIVNQAVKTAKKAWEGGDKEISAVKGRDEKGLPKSS